MISVERIPHEHQRYETVGDWVFEDSGRLNINVSNLPDKRYEYLIAIHEIIEAVLCNNYGISHEMVDEWDKSHADDIDPGGITDCPYYRQHLIATVIEKMLAHELDVDWDEYEEAIEAL